MKIKKATMTKRFIKLRCISTIVTVTLLLTLLTFGLTLNTKAQEIVNTYNDKGILRFVS